MNKRSSFFAVLTCIAAILSGCTKIEDVPYFPEEETYSAASEYSRIEIIEETEPETEEEPKLTAEDFFEIFSGADIKSGKIADNMTDTVTNLSPDVPLKQLSKESVENALADGTLGDTLFEFTVSECRGLLPSDSSDGEMYAFTFRDGEDTEYAVIMGSSETSTIFRADKYISTCGETEYLAYCSVQGGGYILMPIAAGNSDCGIYGVIPIAKYMGYDMSETDDFDGIPDTVSLSFAGAEPTETGKRLYFHLENRFSEEVYYSFTGVFLNGENVSDKLTEETDTRFERAGSIEFSDDIRVKDGDALYFMGAVYKTEDDELICEASLAVIAENIEDALDLSSGEITETTAEETEEEAEDPDGEELSEEPVGETEA